MNMGTSMGMGTQGMGMGLGQYSGFQQPQNISYNQQQPVEQFDEAAFERAFAAAASVEMESQSQKAESAIEEPLERTESQNIDTQSTNDVLLDSSVEHQTLEDVLRAAEPQPNDGPLNQPFIGSDTIIDPSKPVSEQHSGEDPDALARTAQHLINSLSGDTRQKMQDSEFMKLMRGFASGQKGIVGADVVERSSQGGLVEGSPTST
jgi:hypothetical protein